MGAMQKKARKARPRHGVGDNNHSESKALFPE
jgi:hypothetical protein